MKPVMRGRDRPRLLPPPVVRTALPLLVVSLVPVAACGGPPPAPPPVPPELEGRDCPLPLVLPPDEVRPRFVRLRNPTDTELAVFLDRCFWHTRLADVPPGRFRQPRLPDELIGFEEGLRFHAYDHADGRYVGTWVSPVGESGVLEVVLGEEERVERDSLAGDYGLPKGAERSAADQTRTTDPERGYAAVWGLGGGGVLTWACSDDVLFLSVALGRKTRSGQRAGAGDPRVDERPPPIPVGVRFDPSGAWSDAGAWPVTTSFTDAVVAPAEWADSITLRALETGRLELQTDEGRLRRTTFVFDVEGMGAELRLLPCTDDELIPPGSD